MKEDQTVSSLWGQLFSYLTLLDLAKLLLPGLLVLAAYLARDFSLRLQKRRNKPRRLAAVPVIAFEELHVSTEALGKGIYGKVLKGNYRDSPVAVKRLMPCSLAGPRFLPFDTSLQPSDPLDSSVVNEAIKEVLSTSNSEGSLSRYNRGMGTPFGSLLRCTEDDIMSTPYKVTISPVASARQLNVIADIVSTDKLESEVTSDDVVPKKSPTARAMASALGEALWDLGSRSLSAVQRHLLKRQIFREVAEQMALDHPNIVSTFGVSHEPGSGSLLLVSAMAVRGNLYDLLHNSTYDPDTATTVGLIADVSSAMFYLHSQTPGILHPDLNPTRILIDATHCAQLVDITILKRRVPAGAEKPPATLWTAPEVLRSGAPTPASDVFAFGILLYQMVYRREPYEDEDIEDVLADVADPNCRPPRRPQLYQIPTKGLEPLESLMIECWDDDVSRRPTFSQIEGRLEILSNALRKAAARPLASHSFSRMNHHQKENRLLHQMLPPQVALALREGRSVAPENYDCVTIFFSDIVGFTTIASKLEPVEIVDMLDRLYRIFDNLTAVHELFKVETIGDAYMVVGNLRNRQRDHAARVARFALAAVRAANTVMVREGDPFLGTIQIRVGFHSGPVVASVVGQLNPRYCLFGDTVNTASRMESTSESGRVHMSRVAAQLVVRQAPELQPNVLRRPGQLQVKGKGSFRTYWLQSEQESEGKEEVLSPPASQPVLQKRFSVTPRREDYTLGQRSTSLTLPASRAQLAMAALTAKDSIGDVGFPPKDSIRDIGFPPKDSDFTKSDSVPDADLRRMARSLRQSLDVRKFTEEGRAAEAAGGQKQGLSVLRRATVDCSSDGVGFGGLGEIAEEGAQGEISAEPRATGPGRLGSSVARRKLARFGSKSSMSDDEGDEDDVILVHRRTKSLDSSWEADRPPKQSFDTQSLLSSCYD